MSGRSQEIHEESLRRTDIYPNLGDLRDLGSPKIENRITLNKIFNNPDEYNLSLINTDPNFEFVDDDDFPYTSDQFSGKWPLQIKLDNTPGFYDVEDYNIDLFFGTTEDSDHNRRNSESDSSDSDLSSENKKRNSNEKNIIRRRINTSDLRQYIKNPSNIPLRVLDIEKDILDDFTVTLIGRRRSGKSWTARWLMYHLRHRFPCGVVITGTKLNSFWSQYIPDDCVHELQDLNLVIDRVFTRQRYILEHPELNIDPRFFLVLDDVLSDKYWIQHSVCLSKCFTDGRHHKLFTLITTQDPRGIPPTLRENTDLAIVFRQFQKGRKEAVCQDFLDYIENKYLAKKFLWDKTKSVDLSGNILDVAVGDDDEIPVALAVIQSKTTNNMQEIFKTVLSHNPGDFLMGDIDYWRAQMSGNWRAVTNSAELFHERFKVLKPRYVYKNPKYKRKKDIAK